ncbi:MAG: DUF3791 domain-containing protein [Spirochaetales bacterium]|nr:DUF3791 domain-containing protein [Spirochaetales bacterium]
MLYLRNNINSLIRSHYETLHTQSLDESAEPATR